jgi:hypothetical protein
VVFLGSTGTLEIVGLGHATARDGDGHEIERFEGLGGSEPHFANFLRAVRKGACSELHADVEEGHLSSCLVQLAQISYRLGHRRALCDSWARVPEGPGRQALELAVKRVDRTLDTHFSRQAGGQVQVGAELDWDASAECILNHRAANQLLARTYRAPFVVPAAGSV